MPYAMWAYEINIAHEPNPPAGEGEYVAWIPDLAVFGCFAHAWNYDEALHKLVGVYDDLAALCEEQGIALPEPSRGLHRWFKYLVHRWRTDSMIMSSHADMLKLDSMQQIIAMGEAVVPLILSELATHPDHLFIALPEITGEAPSIPEEDYGKIKKIIVHWLAWGVDRTFK